MGERFDAAHGDAHLGRLDETEQWAIVLVLVDDVLAELVGFQPDKVETHKVNALVFAGGQDFGGFARVRTKVLGQHDAVIGAAFLVHGFGKAGHVVFANTRAARRLTHVERDAIADAVNRG